MTTQSPKTEPEEKLATNQKVHFGAGFVSNNLMVIGLEHMVFPVFSLYIGLSPEFIGYAMAIPTIWHAIIDAFVGHFSDNLRTPWGRRRPLIVLGAIASGIAFGLIWMTPGDFSETQKSVWLVASLLLFWTAHAFFFIPLDALGLSLAPNYNERTSLMAYRSFFAKIGQLASGWCFWLVESGWFGTGQRGAVFVSWIWAVLVIFFGVWPGLYLKEPAYKQASASRKLTWLKSVKIALSSPSFLKITGYLFFASSSLSATNAIHFYTNLHHVASGDTELAARLFGASITLNIISGIVVLPAVGWLSKRVGKHVCAQIAVSATGFGALSSWYLMTPNYPWLSLAISPFIGMGIVAVYQLYFAMLADTAEEAALTSGARNEGIYSAVSSSLVKIGQAVALLLSGLMLGWIGIEGKDFVPNDDQIFWLRIARALVPTALTLVAVLCLARYTLTKDRLVELSKKAADQSDEA